MPNNKNMVSWALCPTFWKYQRTHTRFVVLMLCQSFENIVVLPPVGYTWIFGQLFLHTNADVEGSEPSLQRVVSLKTMRGIAASLARMRRIILLTSWSKDSATKLMRAVLLFRLKPRSILRFTYTKARCWSKSTFIQAQIPSSFRLPEQKNSEKHDSAHDRTNKKSTKQAQIIPQTKITVFP